MTLEELEERLLAAAPENRSTPEAWRKAVERFLSAARPPARAEELFKDLPPQARYVGPGPWFDAVRDSHLS